MALSKSEHLQHVRQLIWNMAIILMDKSSEIWDNFILKKSENQIFYRKLTLFQLHLILNSSISKECTEISQYIQAATATSCYFR